MDVDELAVEDPQAVTAVTAVTASSARAASVSVRWYGMTAHSQLRLALPKRALP